MGPRHRREHPRDRAGPGARELLTRAWGDPQITRDSLGQPEVTWAARAPAGRSSSTASSATACRVHPVPCADAGLLRRARGAAGELAKLKIGMKLADARKLAPVRGRRRSGIATGVTTASPFIVWRIDDNPRRRARGYLTCRRAPRTLSPRRGAAARRDRAGRQERARVADRRPAGARPCGRRSASHDLAFDNYLPRGAASASNRTSSTTVPVLRPDDRGGHSRRTRRT